MDAQGTLTRGTQPLYMDLADQLRIRIAAGDYAVGERLPSEPQLCEMTGYSRSTVRSALKVLVHEGNVVKEQGRGTFVSASAPALKKEASELHMGDGQANLPSAEELASRQTGTHLFSFTQNAQLMGMRPSTKTVDIRLVPPTENQLAFFHTPKGEQLVEITRMRYINDDPALLETVWLPEKYKDLSREGLNGSLYKVLKDQYGVRPVKASKTISLVFANEHEAFLLGVVVGTPLLMMEDHALDDSGNPLHISKQAILGDKYRFSISGDIQIKGDAFATGAGETRAAIMPTPVE